MIEPYSTDELNQIAEALSVPLNHEAVQRVHDLATRFIIYHVATDRPPGVGAEMLGEPLVTLHPGCGIVAG